MSDRIKARIAALLRMTRGAGCTEAEAMAAAEKAAALMAEHGLCEADITIGQASVNHATKGRSARDDLWRIVGYCTNTACVFEHVSGARGAALIFVGREPGPEIAAWLVVVLNRAIDTGIADFREGAFYRRRRSTATRRAAVRDFTKGMVLRLSNRLIEVFGPTIDKAASGQAVAARDARFSHAVAFDAPKGKARFDDAIWTGWRAANRVNLAHGIHGGAGAPQRIGRA